ncbi:hypothetical protein D9V41_03230 [Aeromicrobium phragmitis]|uniref:Uncharacterized protein n=1 Tax=Aeromicrobium phragmitis TaxID=2478914 RepID=A0A3L8PN50_9ACTN|nr:hypothetical protein D9V41_03230 [Aeromicrobium phragmitis]
MGSPGVLDLLVGCGWSSSGEFCERRIETGWWSRYGPRSSGLLDQLVGCGWSSSGELCERRIETR